MNVGEKMKTCLKLAEMAFRLPNEETQKLHDLVEQRIRKHSALYGATLNSKTGATSERIRAELRQNAEGLRCWSDDAVDQTTAQEFLL